MNKKFFISYSHTQRKWVLAKLVPCLRAGGSEVLIDRERFSAGQTVLGQMDRTQDEADVNLPMLSPDYFSSNYCIHEMKRAVVRC